MTTIDDGLERVRIVADSISAGGHRLTTLATVVGSRQARYLHTLRSTVCTCGADATISPRWPQPALITGTDFADLFRHPHLTALADAVAQAVLGHQPRLVTDDDLHAPYVTADERAHFDLSMCGMLSGARSHYLQTPRDVLADVARYQHLLISPGPRGGLWHPALPDSHVAFGGENPSPGIYRGWICWQELLIHRGDLP